MREGVAMTPPRAGGDTNANGDGKITPREAVLTAALDIIRIADAGRSSAIR
jgi:hypothetical protein